VKARNITALIAAVALSAAPLATAGAQDLGNTLGRVLEGIQGQDQGRRDTREDDRRYRDDRGYREDDRRYRDERGSYRGDEDRRREALYDQERRLEERQRRLDDERRRVEDERRRYDRR
jgi:hypothetical protein